MAFFSCCTCTCSVMSRIALENALRATAEEFLSPVDCDEGLVASSRHVLDTVTEEILRVDYF